MEPNETGQPHPKIPIENIPNMVPAMMVPSFDKGQSKKTFAPRVSPVVVTPGTSSSSGFVKAPSKAIPLVESTLDQTTPRVMSAPPVSAAGRPAPATLAYVPATPAPATAPTPTPIQKPPAYAFQANQIPHQIPHIPQAPTMPHIEPAPATTGAINPTPAGEEKKTKPEMVIRTFQADAAQAMQRRHVSVATIAIAENMKRTGSATLANESPHHYLKKISFTIFSLLLVVGGGFASYYIYLQSPLSGNHQTTQKVNPIPSIISPDIQKVVDITGISGAGISSTLKHAAESTKLDTGEMLELVLATRLTTGTSSAAKSGSQMQKTSVRTLFSSLGITPPDILVRSIADQWMLGVYQDETGKFPFIILTNNFFQNTYAGMVKWEQGIADDMDVLFTYPNQPTTTTIGSSTVPSAYYSIRGQWSDAVVKNKDVRIFKNEAGKILLMYSFIDKNTLVIATGENVIRDIVDRIEKRTYVR